MLFSKDAWSRLADGSITVTFRRWKRPQAKPGNSYVSPAGMLLVDSVAEVPVDSITDHDARRAGHPDRAGLMRHLGEGGTVFRVEFHLAGPDPRTALRRELPTPTELDDILTRLDRLDRASSHGAWTQPVLRAIAQHPERRAPDLAAGFGRETQTFKRDVRKLKALGLTESLRIGYRLSPRGQAVLDALEGG